MAAEPHDDVDRALASFGVSPITYYNFHNTLRRLDVPAFHVPPLGPRAQPNTVRPDLAPPSSEAGFEGSARKPEPVAAPIHAEPAGATHEPEPVLAADEPEPEPVIATHQPEGDLAAAESEPEPVLAAHEPEPILANDEPASLPILSAHEPEPALVDNGLESAPVLAAHEPEPALVDNGLVSAPVLAAHEPEPGVVEPQPEPEPVVEAPETKPELEPVLDENESDPMLADAEPEPAHLPPVLAPVWSLAGLAAARATPDPGPQRASSLSDIAAAAPIVPRLEGLLWGTGQAEAAALVPASSPAAEPHPATSVMSQRPTDELMEFRLSHLGMFDAAATAPAAPPRPTPAEAAEDRIAIAEPVGLSMFHDAALTSPPSTDPTEDRVARLGPVGLSMAAPLAASATSVDPAMDDAEGRVARLGPVGLPPAAPPASLAPPQPLPSSVPTNHDGGDMFRLLSGRRELENRAGEAVGVSRFSLGHHHPGPAASRPALLPVKTTTPPVGPPAAPLDPAGPDLFRRL